MKGVYEALAVVIPMIVVVAAAAMLALAPVSVESDPEPTDPTPPVDPEPGYPTEPPKGISYDKTTFTLSSKSVISWHVFDELHAYTMDKPAYEGPSTGKKTVYEGYDCESSEITLSPGMYLITVADYTFEMTIPGKVTRTLDWEYDFNGTKYPVSVTYEIDISEYIGINKKSKAYNDTDNMPHMFTDLPTLVTVNDTVRDIVAQLEKRFVQIGGSTSDRHAYAEFLVSMAQVPIEYPTYRNYGDMQIWGQDEYWQNTLETLYHTVGDCEDKAALACSLFIAAGYDAAMCGVIGHVVAGIALDDFTERSEEELKDFGMDKWVLATGKDVTGQDTETLYYAVETIQEEQHYIGYLLSGSANCIGEDTMFWGMAGFYPVH